MKRIKSVLFAGLLSFTFALSACNQPHVHTYSEEWAFNDTQHWRPATCGHDVCTDLGYHVDSDNDGECDVCGVTNSGKKDFKNIVFESQTFTYDGMTHSLEVKNAPAGTNIVYTNNNKVEIGSYSVKATLSKEGYNTKVVFATLTIKNATFKDISFDNLTVDYDGKPHTIEAKGVPSFAKVTYENNTQVDVGVYNAKATIKATGYETLVLNATLTIKGKQFTGISFNDVTVDYDGKTHSVAVVGAPEGASIEYTNNNKVDVGTYTVTATISAPGYETLVRKATLTINGNEFTDITFEDKTFVFDYEYHSIYVEGAPKFATITYKNNDQKNKGTYTVTATISAPGYETLVLSATMIISDHVFPDYKIDDFYLIYDNKDINLKQYFEGYEDDLDQKRIDYSVVYKINGVKKTDPVIKNVGTYTVSATYSAQNYGSKTISFKITISDKIGGVDSTKTAFNITDNLKFNDLYAEIKKGNYSLKIEYFDEYDRDKDDIYEESIKSEKLIHNFFVTEEAFAGRHNEDSTYLLATDYYVTKGSKYAFKTEYSYGEVEITKMPVDCYLETVIDIAEGMKPFALLKESVDGGFENSLTHGGVVSYGSYEIDSANNEFIVYDRTPNYHPEYNHNETAKLTYYNIGNTKVTIPDALKVKEEKADIYNYANFLKNGIEFSYSEYEGYMTADFEMSELRAAYVKDGCNYTLDAMFDDIQVGHISWWGVRYSYECDLSNYNLYLYFDDDGYYHGEYESLNDLGPYVWRAVQNFSYYKANVYYYDEWPTL